MTKNKTIYVALRMNELEASQLDFIRQDGETRSAAIRRLIEEEFCKAQDDIRGQQQETDRIPY